MESKSLMAAVIDTEKKADFILECLEETFPDCKISTASFSRKTNKNMAITTKPIEILTTLNIEACLVGGTLL